MNGIVRFLETISQFLSRVTVALSCFVLAAMAVHVSIDILMRYLAGSSLGATLEIGTYYYMVAVAFLGLANAQLGNHHITVDIVAELLPERGRHMLTLFANVVAAAFVLVYSRASFLAAMQNMVIGEYTITAKFLMPIWPSRWVLFVSLVALFVVLLVQILRQILELAAERAETQR
jgi:TRAP-type C4-dicarboxylate transport system permease small subunit